MLVLYLYFEQIVAKHTRDQMVNSDRLACRIERSQEPIHVTRIADTLLLFFAYYRKTIFILSNVRNNTFRLLEYLVCFCCYYFAEKRTRSLLKTDYTSALCTLVSRTFISRTETIGKWFYYMQATGLLQ